ncbi:MAG: BrxA/BrxB family bacilliredoxin [Acidobacteriota bacterium]
MPYPEEWVKPAREELIQLGIQELHTPQEVDEALKGKEGTVMVVVNSICGCAAGKARPGIARALQEEPRPDLVTTVFAGQDVEATARAREYFLPYPPSSPSVALLRDGKLVFMLQRHQIESREAEAIASDLREAFQEYCKPPVSQE